MTRHFAHRLPTAKQDLYMIPQSENHPDMPERLLISRAGGDSSRLTRQRLVMGRRVRHER